MKMYDRERSLLTPNVNGFYLSWFSFAVFDIFVAICSRYGTTITLLNPLWIAYALYCSAETDRGKPYGNNGGNRNGRARESCQGSFPVITIQANPKT